VLHLNSSFTLGVWDLYFDLKKMLSILFERINLKDEIQGIMGIFMVYAL
jgi:hypothetical protein